MVKYFAYRWIISINYLVCRVVKEDGGGSSFTSLDIHEETDETEATEKQDSDSQVFFNAVLYVLQKMFVFEKCFN